jgi:hypothetical protein
MDVVGCDAEDLPERIAQRRCRPGTFHCRTKLAVLLAEDVEHVGPRPLGQSPGHGGPVGTLERKGPASVPGRLG